MACEALAPAKINLTLSVIGQRDDGYHELDSLMVPLDFGDTIAVAAAPELTVTRAGPTAADLPPLQQDLVWRAAVRLATYLSERGRRPAGAQIAVYKRIPAAAGLGGGSADAAMTLKLLNALWGEPLATAELSALAAELGSDVPFFLAGGPARVTGRGEVVEPLAGLPPFWTVLVTPSVPKVTGAVYARLHRHTPWPQPDVGAALAAWQAGDWQALAAVAGNSLAAPMVADHPELVVLQQRLQQAGAVLALMSGAGPTVFGLVPDEQAARAVAARMAERYEVVHVARALTG